MNASNSIDTTEPSTSAAEPETEVEAVGDVMSLTSFIEEFGEGLLAQVSHQNPPVDDGSRDAQRDAVINRLKRKPFDAQRDTVHAVSKLLLNEGLPAAVINAEMGTGKTMMAICTAAVLQASGLPRTLVISPPHLVYKWRREIKETVPNARVWILNGPDTLRKLLMLRAALSLRAPTEPEFFVLGRVRMRMGFHWQPAFAVHSGLDRDPQGQNLRAQWAACPRCGTVVSRPDADGHPLPVSLAMAQALLSEQRSQCQNDKCREPLWTLIRPGRPERNYRDLVRDALQQMPTIGAKTADRLLDRFGEDLLGTMLGDNVHEFLYLMDEHGNLVFSDRQAARMERSLANFEFSFGEGGYQPTEFIKRYLPAGYFGTLIVDEGHEYKNAGSAQGQAMGVLARKCRKTLLLTGTLMGGYADDLFHLLWRLHPKQMKADGFGPNDRGSMTGSAMNFMREHGVLKDIYKEGSRVSHRTAKGTHISHRVAKAPGFGPKGIMRYVLPMTVFLKLKDIGQKVLPPYREYFTSIPMAEAQQAAYGRMAGVLGSELRQALRAGDSSLLGVVLNVLLAWPDCAFRVETVSHPRTRKQLLLQPAVFVDGQVAPKEQALVDLCLQQKALGRRVLAYTVYTGGRDTSSRLKALLEERHFKVAVLKASVEATQREDWVAEQVDRGIDVLICNPELVKTGLDLLEFPTIVFLQSGYNVYTVQQAARRSWRIGQKHPVEVHYLGYEGSAQMECLRLMAKKIAVSQSTSGDMPDSGLEILNDSSDSIEVALARQLVA